MRSLILGLDAFDPIFFEKLHSQGKTPNLSSIAEMGGYSRFEVVNPPQSEVSWTSIATGLNPGEHGMFDFVHRDPLSYGLQVSLLPMERSLGGTQFVRPYRAKSIFDIAADRGYPASSLWWPATFPARPDSPVRTLPGLGTPDIQGRMGVGSSFTTSVNSESRMGKTPVYPLKAGPRGNYQAELPGPLIKQGGDSKNAVLPLELKLIDDQNIEIKIDREIFNLQLGQWSPILEIRFKVGFLSTVSAITRVIATQIKPEVQLYFLPLQIHPIHPIWRYGTPASFVKDAWQSCGPFLTVGWPQDTIGLEDGCISDDQFLDLCDDIYTARHRLLFHLLDQFNEGLLASIFDSLDRIQHMFWKRNPAIIEAWYLRLDRLVGDVVQRLDTLSGEKPRLLIMSDHGFKNLDYKVHLNKWLIERGYLSLLSNARGSDLKAVSWEGSQAYAVGLNSLYLNLEGREAKGSLRLADQERVVAQLQKDLLSWKGPDGRQVVSRVHTNEQVFSGPSAKDGPDLLIGYTAGYRASPETGLGGWDSEAIIPNTGHWEADHCYDAESVPGVIFSPQGLRGNTHPSYRDIPELAIDAAPQPGRGAPPPRVEVQDQEEVEQRLKSLGYL